MSFAHRHRGLGARQQLGIAHRVSGRLRAGGRCAQAEQAREYDPGE
jgi:hypothetical protein